MQLPPFLPSFRPLPGVLCLLLMGCDKPQDTGDPSPCAGASYPSADLDVDPEGPLTQIHPWAAWDGQAIRLVWNRPDADGNFDVFTGRLALDGSVAEAPTSLDGDLAGNHTYPRVAAGPAGALAVWQTDDQVSADNLDLYARAPGSDRVHLVFAQEGAPITGNTWMPSIAAHPEGGFLVAAAAAPGDTFQVMTQAVDASGEPTGDAVFSAKDDTTSQYDPSLSVGADGSRVLAWEEWDAAGATYVRVARYAPGSDTPTSVSREDDGTALPTTAWPFAAWVDGDYDIVVSDGDRKVVLGDPGEVDHSAALAARDQAVKVAWLRQISGIRNAIVVQDLDWPDVGEPQVLETASDVAPYPLTLVPVCESAWFLAWVEGENPDYVVRGRFL